MLSTVRLWCAYGEAGVWSRGQPGRSCWQQADTSSEGPKCPSSRVLHGLGALAKPGAKRQTQEGIAGWPGFDPDFAEEPGLIEPYLSAIRVKPQIGIRAGRMVRWLLRLGVGLGSEPDDGARTWPLWPCPSAPSPQST